MHNKWSSCLCSGKWKLAIKDSLELVEVLTKPFTLGKPNGNRKNSYIKFTLKIMVHKFYHNWLATVQQCATAHSTQLYKLLESGNGTKISDEKWHSAKTRYLKRKNDKRVLYVKGTRIMNA